MSTNAEAPQMESVQEQAKEELAALMNEINDLENFRGSETDAPLEETLSELKEEPAAEAAVGSTILETAPALPPSEHEAESMAASILGLSPEVPEETPEDIPEQMPEMEEESNVIALHPEPLETMADSERPEDFSSPTAATSGGDLDLHLQGVETFSIQARVGGREISVTLAQDSISVRTGDGTEVRLPLRQLSKAS